MAVLEGDFIITVGGGGGIGRAKVIDTCITCSTKEIFVGFMGGEVGLSPL